jgi:hypothetical protein
MRPAEVGVQRVNDLGIGGAEPAIQRGRNRRLFFLNILDSENP